MYARTPTVTALFLVSLLVWGCSTKPDPARLTPIDSPERFAFAGG